LLIILSKSATSETVQIAEHLAKKGENVAILHVQDACVAVTIKEYCDKLERSKIHVYSLKADLEARGLRNKTGKNVRLIDYKQWVELLMEEHDKIVSWTS